MRKLLNPLGKVAEIDLTDLYITTFMSIYETYTDVELSDEEKSDEIFGILAGFHSIAMVTNVLGD